MGRSSKKIWRDPGVTCCAAAMVTPFTRATAMTLPADLWAASGSDSAIGQRITVDAE
jgi:hypothetical protein